jgi:hypothetical protein
VVVVVDPYAVEARLLTPTDKLDQLRDWQPDWHPDIYPNLLSPVAHCLKPDLPTALSPKLPIEETLSSYRGWFSWRYQGVLLPSAPEQ